MDFWKGYFVERNEESFRFQIRKHFDKLFGSELEFKICRLHEWDAIVTAVCKHQGWIQFVYDGVEYQTKYLNGDIHETIKNSIKI